MDKTSKGAIARAEAAEAYATLTREAYRVRLDIRTEERDQFQTALTESRAEVKRLSEALAIARNALAVEVKPRSGSCETPARLALPVSPALGSPNDRVRLLSARESWEAHRDRLARICARPGCTHPLYQHAFHPHHHGPPHECLIGSEINKTEAKCTCSGFVDPETP